MHCMSLEAASIDLDCLAVYVEAAVAMLFVHDSDH